MRREDDYFIVSRQTNSNPEEEESAYTYLIKNSYIVIVGVTALEGALHG